ncbi:conserved exported hypothetical protein [Capnocytophaga canimorsus]|uniref:Uncharacterized protein n=1 Tax=Capnocytophaga canimorsus TaxID=28188 RepID=A0A0B7H7Q7_9FLAO|nr:hypothetical protein [Capnocytophaga canimorsus]ATA76120.1 sensor of ECF-type sigma factor [Capnocytophaga canimorsus]PJI80317.1 hypothetical protein CLV61_1171 [Capnocytophaga canimorsus]CEN35400.1 conserved exported hypothetical protein [Capnocytophaga canimorsus]STA71224.1 Uncharacterised protein [Capnocytophaga canimorsus]
MKNILIFSTLLFCFCNVWGQHNEKYEKIKSLKIAYITEKIDLTPQEAKAFWPIYNKYSDKIHELHNGGLGKCRKTASEKGNQLSEKEALELIEKEEEINLEIVKTSKEMNLQLLKVISAKKIVLLKQAEKEFRHRLIKQYKEHK